MPACCPKPPKGWKACGWSVPPPASADCLRPIAAGRWSSSAAWRHGWPGAARVLAPALAAVAATPALLALAGLPFSFFAAMALVLLLSLATDYAVFCAEDRDGDPVTLVSVWLAMASTLLSFGLLALSAVPAVRAFGATMLVGVALAFALAPWAAKRR